MLKTFENKNGIIQKQRTEKRSKKLKEKKHVVGTASGHRVVKYVSYTQMKRLGPAAPTSFWCLSHSRAGSSHVCQLIKRIEKIGVKDLRSKSVSCGDGTLGFVEF